MKFNLILINVINSVPGIDILNSGICVNHDEDREEQTPQIFDWELHPKIKTTGGQHW